VLRSVKEMQEYAAAAVDGEIGEVEEFFLDDRYWTIRYLVVGMSDDVTYRRVLITPAALGQPDREEQVLRVELSLERARNSPDVDSDRPISRQGRPESGTPEEEPGQPGDPHLRSTKEVIGYHIRARDGEIGHSKGTRIGTLGDVVLDLKGQLVAYALDQVFVEGPLAESERIPVEAAHSLGHDVLIVDGNTAD
jgi:sporulation protein YlmC with PRC-barrel domain